MKIIDDPIEVQSNGVTQSVAFGIKSTGLPHIFNVLRNQLYSDKVLAVIREYSANAIDANKQAGKGDTPIEVTLPSAVNPMAAAAVSGQGQGYSPGQLFNPESGYANAINAGNYQGKLAARTATQANKAAMWGAGISAAGNMLAPGFGEGGRWGG